MLQRIMRVTYCVKVIICSSFLVCRSNRQGLLSLIRQPMTHLRLVIKADRKAGQAHLVHPHNSKTASAVRVMATGRSSSKYSKNNNKQGHQIIINNPGSKMHGHRKVGALTLI